MKVGNAGFHTFGVVTPGSARAQINLEYLARARVQKRRHLLPDTLVGTAKHTTMINGIGVVGGRRRHRS